jgi:hypothetical protein
MIVLHTIRFGPALVAPVPWEGRQIHNQLIALREGGACDHVRRINYDHKMKISGIQLPLPYLASSVPFLGVVRLHAVGTLTP